jgi:hypothetical protein
VQILKATPPEGAAWLEERRVRVTGAARGRVARGFAGAAPDGRRAQIMIARV